MKAISLKQPWANFVRDKRKTIEMRTWSTHHRGPLLICASMTIDEAGVKAWGPEGIVTVLPRGVAIAIANLVDIRWMRREDEEAAMCSWEPGYYAWVLEDVKRIREFPVKGRLGIFETEIPDLDRPAAGVAL